MSAHCHCAPSGCHPGSLLTLYIYIDKGIQADSQRSHWLFVMHKFFLIVSASKSKNQRLVLIKKICLQITYREQGYTIKGKPRGLFKLRPNGVKDFIF